MRPNNEEKRNTQKSQDERRETRKKLKFQKKQELLVLMMKPHISLRSPTNYLSNVVSEPNTLRMSLWLPVVASHMCEMASCLLRTNGNQPRLTLFFLQAFEGELRSRPIAASSYVIRARRLKLKLQGELWLWLGRFFYDFYNTIQLFL